MISYALILTFAALVFAAFAFLAWVADYVIPAYDKWITEQVRRDREGR